MDPAQYYHHNPVHMSEEEQVERELSFGHLDRAITAVQQRISPAPGPGPRVLSPIEETGESVIHRNGSTSSGGSSRATAISQPQPQPQPSVQARVAAQGYAQVDQDDDEYDEEEEEYDDDYDQEQYLQHQQHQLQQGQHAQMPPSGPGWSAQAYQQYQQRGYGPALVVQSWTGSHQQPYGYQHPNVSQHSAYDSLYTAATGNTSRPPSSVYPGLGGYTAPTYNPPRSRSPTPDDYDIVEKHDIEAEPEKRPVSDSSSGTLTVDDTPVLPHSTHHYGPAPAHMERRHKTKKRVKLYRGHLVVPLDIPSRLVLPHNTNDSEFTKTTYTAITCDPDEFEKKRFCLRQNVSDRQTELMVVITMYNEDEILFTRTLYGVMKNIAHLCSRKASQTWGPDSWKKVVVCIVADGRKKVHPRVLDCLTALGVYRGDVMKNSVNGQDVEGHMFEYTTSFGLDPNLHFKYPDKGIVPTQIILLIKEKNAKKINSHRWCLNAFAPMLLPNVIILLDVGTRPGHKSLYKLWKTFDMNSNVGGACGEIAVYKGRRWSALLNPLVAAQNFEYKMSGILDKPTEAAFGYISVLPGAFSAYRYIALKNDKNGNGPLCSYFKGEHVHGRDSDIFTSNMYLAEDRILCFELVARANSAWVLRYVRGAIGETDVPDSLPEFILQRRRWLNGSFFAAVYALWHVGQMLGSGHSMSRKVLLGIEAFYNTINLIFAWFAIGNYYIFFILLTSSLQDIPGLKPMKIVNDIIQAVYASLLVSCFIFSMGNKPRGSTFKYKLAVWLFAALTTYMLVCAGICVVRILRQGGSMYGQMMLSLLATFGMYIASSLIAFDPWHLFTSFLQYLLVSPMYINVLNIYAFANLDDISWGTKGEDKAPEMELGAVMPDHQENVDLELVEAADVNDVYMEVLHNLKVRKPVPSAERSQGDLDQMAKDYYANVRTNVLLFWVLSNGLLVVCILTGGGASKTFSDDSNEGRTQRAYMTFILAFVAITSIIRMLASTMYVIVQLFTG